MAECDHINAENGNSMIGPWNGRISCSKCQAVFVEASKLDNYSQLLATAYQLAGLVGAPVRFLDAYALHEPADIDSLLPVNLDELDEFKALSSRLEEAELDAKMVARLSHQYRNEAERLQSRLGRALDLAAELRNYFNTVELGHRVELKLETDLYVLLNEVQGIDSRTR